MKREDRLDIFSLLYPSVAMHVTELEKKYLRNVVLLDDGRSLSSLTAPRSSNENDSVAVFRRGKSHCRQTVTSLMKKFFFK